MPRDLPTIPSAFDCGKEYFRTSLVGRREVARLGLGKTTSLNVRRVLLGKMQAYDAVITMIDGRDMAITPTERMSDYD